MKKYKDLKAVCFVDSTYTMLIYMLVYGKEQFDKTFFFISDAFSSEFQSKLKYKEFLSYVKMTSQPFVLRVLCRFWLKCTAYMKWPFLCTLPIFGQDHLWYTPALLRKRSMVVIEDGLANYIESALVRPSTMKHKWLYRLLFGSSMCYGEYGNSKYASQVVLTGAMGSIPACLKEKAILVDIRKLWETCDYKDYILDMFSFNKEEIEKLREKKVIILAQPFNQGVGDEVMREIYQGIINQYNAEDVVIKTHPRDTMDYRGMFPDVMVYSKKMPAELFSLIGLYFTDAYTINSTSIFSFPKKCKKHLLGFKCHPELLNVYGQFEIEELNPN